MPAPGFVIRAIRPSDDVAVREIIQTVMPQFGASGPGFALHDAEVQAMSAHYTDSRAQYFVVTISERVLGGAGFAPLAGEDPTTCELKKMYFLPQLRGLGAGSALITHCMQQARLAGYRSMYLETLTGMDQAKALYVKHGFQPLSAAMGTTGHFGCDQFYLRAL
jgi:putative acetyltransferase